MIAHGERKHGNDDHHSGNRTDRRRHAGSPAQRPGGAALNFLQLIEQALNGLIQLRITTVIGPVHIDGEGTDTTVKLRNPDEGDGMMTEINLLNGKITNVISASLPPAPWRASAISIRPRSSAARPS